MTSYDEARAIAAEIGYPVLVRPSYVLGGRGMQIVYADEALRAYIDAATEISPDRPVLVDRFIDDAVEIDVDALRAHCGESLARFKVPHEVHVVDDMPRTSIGKIRKSELRDKARGDR